MLEILKYGGERGEKRKGLESNLGDGGQNRRGIKLRPGLF